MLKFSRLFCAAALMTPVLALGQDVAVTPVPDDAGAMPRASQILGSTVQLQGTDNFGKVDDIILGTNGNPSYLVVSNNGQFVPLPWSAGNFNYGQRTVTYPVAAAALQPLMFQRNAYPNFADQQYISRVRQVFPAGVNANAVAPVPGGTVIKEKIRVLPNGDVKVKERIR